MRSEIANLGAPYWKPCPRCGRAIPMSFDECAGCRERKVVA